MEQTADVESTEMPSKQTEVTVVRDTASQLMQDTFGVATKAGHLKKLLLSIATFCQGMFKPKRDFSKAGATHFKSDRWDVDKKKGSRHHGWSKVKATKPSKIVLEYPSGVRLLVENADITIISQLLKM